MKALVREGMEEGALGLTCALLYVPDVYMSTAELTSLAAVSSEYAAGSPRISGARETSCGAVGEMITIARDAHTGVEIYHLKASGEDSWPLLDPVLDRIEAARAEGVDITANMYTYTAAATGLDAPCPLGTGGRIQCVGGTIERPVIRDRLKKEMTTPSDAWESLYMEAGAPENILLSHSRMRSSNR